MRAAFFALLLAVSGVALPARPAAAQTAEQMEFALRDFAQWAQRVNSFNTELIVLYQSADALNALVDTALAGEKDEATALGEVEAWRLSFVQGIQTLRARVDAELNPPTLNPALGLDVLQTMADATSQRLREAIDQSATFADGMAEVSAATIRGDVGPDAGAVQLAMNLARELIEFENGSLRLMAAMMPPDHPNSNVALARIAVNGALSAIFDALIADVRGETAFTPERLSSLRASTAEIREQIRLGRAAAVRGRIFVEQGTAAFSAPMRAGIGRTFDSMEETFVTLERAASMIERANAPQNGKDMGESLVALLYAFDDIAIELQAQSDYRARQIDIPAPTL